ncbi:xanthine dehydrogenase accessory protein XdhC [Paragemmobacter straminiformis]|uniref:Xanthine dehydrogenase accessory protein XdhC n=1 Tax=Paragemmobacter straminiformis TaxID=2045119 RepID=A0A842I6J4_9RHOB|nr:xanthine dehydrogenase accessory protein XdhC [Gemmobacter straminiformis]MBC2834997.1 xanthine dehydrogenase accessory protein XdhC [Gemmobacter straminiformis]
MFDLAALAEAVHRHGSVARVVIAAHDGSSPRETGAAMLVWQGGQSGTIGGGALEHEATLRGRALLARGGSRLDRTALGPNLGQCCGGAVTVLTEIYDASNLPTPAAGLIARSADGRAMPLAAKRILDRARAQGIVPAPTLTQGWFVEPLSRPARHLWVWGAGHVGRALVATLSPLPDLHITWVDVAADRFPEAVPAGVTRRAEPDAAALVAQAPQEAEHLILTFSHALDLDLCHRLLAHGFARCGLIGSATKWARFRSRLAALGHAPAHIARIDCPIGNPALGKHPQAIAIGVAADFLDRKTNASRQENAG